MNLWKGAGIMPKKDFKNNPALAFIGNTQTIEPETSGTHEPQSTQRTQSESGMIPEVATPPDFTDGFPVTPSAPAKPRYYRLNLKLKAEHKEYLERVSWEAHKSITQYLNDLIEADKAIKDTQNT
jgi:hypothetical protein